VVAEIPGSDTPDEFVIVGGHLDSWDGATGATDNGTGIATTLEAARILVKAGVKPRRSIRFMLWSGEEQGLLGSRAYVKAHPELLPKVSAVLVHDGGTNYLSSLGGTEAMMSDFQEVFAPVMSLDPKFPFEVKKIAGLGRVRQRPRLIPERERAGLLLGSDRQGGLHAHPSHPVRHLRRGRAGVPEALVRWSSRSRPSGSPSLTTGSRAKSSAPLARAAAEGSACSSTS